MKIGDAARAAGLPVKTVRYYADIGLVSPRSRTSSGYRDYADDDVRRLRFVRQSRAFGFNVEECRELLSLYADRSRASADVKRIAQAKVAELDLRLRELHALRDELSSLAAACQGDDRPDCPILAGLAGTQDKQRAPT
ncbi:MAG: Cu(I)-responsive transcriptional regulator [Pseudomonadota bacterium]